jgi:hypothetical protein
MRAATRERMIAIVARAVVLAGVMLKLGREAKNMHSFAI